MNERKRKIQQEWREDWTKSDYCLCVTGSVARNEETSFSDTDLLVIHQNDEPSSRMNEDIISTLSARLENASITVRSLDDIASMLETDIRSWVAQMDAVFLTGAEKVFCLFRTIVRDGVLQKNAQIIEALEALTKERYAQYGNAVSLLEPNVKNSAGTLRDVHTVYYLGLLDALVDIPVSTDPWPAVPSVLNQLSLIPERRAALRAAYEFLLQVRDQMHVVSGHLHDTLDYDLQRKVARLLGFGEQEQRKGVELFMHSYYRHARSVHISLQLVFHDQKRKLGMDRVTDQGILSLDDASETLDDVGIMRLFLKMAQRRSSPGGDIIRAMDTVADTHFSPEALRLFDQILGMPHHVADTLKVMHELGVLGRILPEFSALEHFFQHNVYHFFTADEHTLRAIHACETSMREQDHIARVLAELPDVSVLYYAVLLHDIAKPLDLPRHEFVGAELAPEILKRFGRDDIVETVSFLVREHLSMEQLAFRRNIREVTTLQPFIQRIRTVERLNLLYLLTVADMSALNPGVLTDWKRELLRELYDTVRHVLETGDTGVEQIQQQIEETVPESALSETEYTAAIQDVIDGQRVRIHLQHHRAYTEVSIFCIDRPQLLALFSAALFGADCSIVDASIDTHNDVVVDTFRVVDIFSGKHLRAEQAAQLRQMIQSVCAGELDAEQLFERYRRKWVRKLRKLPKKNVTLDVAYIPHFSADGGEQTIVEVYAPDTFGLLYRLASELSTFGLNVVFAKIATRVDGVVDSFYVVDSEGKAFTDEQKRQELKQRLLGQISILTQ